MNSPSRSPPLARLRMALCGCTFRPSALRGHICVHMEHWQQTDMMSCRLSFGDFRSSRG